MFGIGMTELMVIFVIGLLVLGPKRLPELARSLGRGLAEFRRASMDIRREFMDVADEVRIRPPSLKETAEGMPPQAGDIESGDEREQEAKRRQAEAQRDARADAPDPEAHPDAPEDAADAPPKPEAPSSGSGHG